MCVVYRNTATSKVHNTSVICLLLNNYRTTFWISSFYFGASMTNRFPCILQFWTSYRLLPIEFLSYSNGITKHDFFFLLRESGRKGSPNSINVELFSATLWREPRHECNTKRAGKKNNKVKQRTKWNDCFLTVTREPANLSWIENDKSI